MTDRPPLPVQELLGNLIGDTSSDYNDSDEPGWYWHTWDEDASTLTVEYKPDDDPGLDEEYQPTCGPTVIRFRLVTEPEGDQS